MSIRTYFENIADAIKTKGGTSTALTPAEMPRAILDLPTGSSTASGVTYDNTASGLTANNVQNAIDELADDVSTIYSDLSELEYKITMYAFPSTSYTANTEKNGTIDLSPYNTSGYKAVGILGYNVGVQASVRRLYVYENTLYYSITATATASTDWVIFVMEQKA